MPFGGLAGPNPQRWDSWFEKRQRRKRADGTYVLRTDGRELVSKAQLQSKLLELLQ